MTEYSAASQISPSFESVYKVRATMTDPAQGRNDTDVGVYKAIRQYFEQFEAELDSSQEISVRLTSFGNEVDFRPETIGFSAPGLITFIGSTDAGKKVQLVQHISQLSFMLNAAQKLNEQPLRISFTPYGVQSPMQSRCVQASLSGNR